jgi:DNA adenine methylase
MLTNEMPADPRRVVNVASVPQRSPFRYPGGKTWLVPQIRKWLRAQPEKPAELVEPFAGGGIVSLTAAFEDLVQRVVMVELDEDVAAVWQTVLNGDATWLADSIMALEITHETVDAVFARRTASRRDRALATIVENRVNRGGIMAPGAGRVKNGENGKGLLSRWYPTTLRDRILNIAGVKNRVECLQEDGLAVMAAKASRPDVAYFIDPPYTVAGRRLYKHNELDHEALFAQAAKLRGQFLMTYDDAAEVRRLARKHGLETERVAMKTTHHSEKTELLISRDLDWLR